MKIRATYNGHFPQKWESRWTAIDDDTYDGPGSPIGWGNSEAEAIADLKEQLAERLS
jgi:hypothetical protein